MAGNPFSFFYWQDYMNDAELKGCSAAAQGFWMRCLCVAAMASKVGHVLVGGAKPDDDDLSDLFGHRSFPPDAIRGYREELVRRKVCDLDRDGVMISRKMIRDEKKRLRNSAAGKKSVEVRQGKETRIPTGSNGVSQPHSHIPIPITKTPSVADEASWVQKVSEALGFDITALHPSKAVKLISSWASIRDQGVDLDLDFLPVIEEARAKGRVPADLSSLRFFEKAALERRDARILLAGMPKIEIQFEDTDAAGWEHRVRMWLDTGYWPAKYGPRPRTGACRCPSKMLKAGLDLWEEQGSHPENGFPADPNGRIKRWEDLRDLRTSNDCDYGDGPQPGSNVVPLKARA